MRIRRLSGLILLACVVAPAAVLAAISIPAIETDLTGTWMGMLALVIFFAAYALIVSEEAIHLRKSKPIMSNTICWNSRSCFYFCSRP